MDYVKTLVAGAHLPNAAHIDRVIASVKANPDHWTSPRDESGWAARETARETALEAICSQGRLKAWYLVRKDTVENDSPNDTWGVVLALFALVAYDDCAYMIDSDPGELAILAKFGDPRAILLLPACTAFHSLKEIE